ncbi:uncharacterized protein LOC144452920 [Glandiceps talaboti]
MTCLREDKARHEIECTYAKISQNCGCCRKETSTAKRCSACLTIWYCGSDCQRKHWKFHKASCEQTREDIINIAKAGQIPTRREQGQKFGYTGVYYWGNVPAVDMLKLPQNEWNDNQFDKLHILFAGVGDLRNIIKTGASLPNAFKGQVEFYLNDEDENILARNMLFLFMMFTCDYIAPTADALVQLWYSISITDDHQQRLEKSLKELSKINREDLLVITNSKINISEEHLRSLKAVWSIWLKSLQEGGPQNHIIKQRHFYISIDSGSVNGWSNYMRCIPEQHKQSIQEWLDNGVLLASRNPKKEEAIFQNVTLLNKNKLSGENCFLTPELLMFPEWYLNEPLVYSISADSTPFTCWDYVEAKSQCNVPDVSEMYSVYISDVIQKFAFNLRKGLLSFQFVLGNCFQLTREINPEETKFDRIATSNLSDYYGIPVILNYFKPFLNSTNPKSVIITELMNWERAVKAVYGDPFRLQNPFLLRDATNLSGQIRDTGISFEDLTMRCFIEYSDTFLPFINYLRADFLLHKTKTSQGEINRKNIPTFTEISRYNGLSLRDYHHELNRVVPFRWRYNNRRVTQLHGCERNLEWTIAQ